MRTIPKWSEQTLRKVSSGAPALAELRLSVPSASLYQRSIMSDLAKKALQKQSGSAFPQTKAPWAMDDEELEELGDGFGDLASRRVAREHTNLPLQATLCRALMQWQSGRSQLRTY